MYPGVCNCGHFDLTILDSRLASVSDVDAVGAGSAFDQSLTTTPAGSPVSSTRTPVAVSGLTALPQGGFDLPMPVVVGGSQATGPLLVGLVAPAMLSVDQAFVVGL